MAGTHRICVIPGDGVGAEVIPQALRVLDAAAATCGFGLEFDQRPWGSAYFREHCLMMPPEAAQDFGTVLFSMKFTMSVWWTSRSVEMPPE